MPMSIPTKATVSCTQRRLFMVGMIIGLISLSGCQHIQATKSPIPIIIHSHTKLPSQPEPTPTDAMPTKNPPISPQTQKPNTIFILEDWF